MPEQIMPKSKNSPERSAAEIYQELDDLRNEIISTMGDNMTQLQQEALADSDLEKVNKVLLELDKLDDELRQKWDRFFQLVKDWEEATKREKE